MKLALAIVMALAGCHREKPIPACRDLPVLAQHYADCAPPGDERASRDDFARDLLRDPIGHEETMRGGDERYCAKLALWMDSKCPNLMSEADRARDEAILDRPVEFSHPQSSDPEVQAVYDETMALRDRMCACPDPHCGSQVHDELAARQHLTGDQLRAFLRLLDEIAQCQASIGRAKPAR